jgi:hypothetical protein
MSGNGTMNNHDFMYLFKYYFHEASQEMDIADIHQYNNNTY